MSRLKAAEQSLEGGTHQYGNIGRGLVSRGEKPIEPRYSWFSAKTIEVVSHVFVVGGKALKWLGGVKSYQPISNSEYQQINSMGNSPSVLRSVDERATAQTAN